MKKHIFLSAALLLLTASCSNDENNEQKEPTQTVQFSFTNEDFGEDETPTRAGAAETKPQTIDLGDCEAEITVESEPAAKKTRGAQTPANGHYTIRAYQSGVLKGEIKGTFNGTTFTPDATSKSEIYLMPHGNYDFVAFNDDVTPSGNDLIVTRDKAETAMIGTVTENINQEPKQQVTFTMKHVGARLRTQFVCQKHIPENITATLEATAANAIPISVAYNPATKTYTGVGGAMTPKQNNSLASTEEKYTASNYGENYSYTSTSDYHYFLPTTEGSKLKLTGISAGTVFWKPIPVFNISQLNATLQMAANKSYLVKIKLKPNYTYLMSDGTTGFFRDTTFGGGSKTPIAVAIEPNKHLAIALQEATNPPGNTWTTPVYSDVQVNIDVKTKFSDMFVLENGYEETWDPNYSTNNVTGEKIKGKNPQFPAFKAAAEYSPTLPSGVNLTNGMENKKWYLPACGETKYVAGLGFGDVSSITDFAVISNWYGRLANIAFTQVNGTTILPFYSFGQEKWFWSTSEYVNPNGHYSACSMGIHPDYVSWYAPGRTNSLWKIRAFINY